MAKRRSTYRTKARKPSYRRPATRRGSRRSARARSGAQTIRIVLEQGAPQFPNPGTGSVVPVTPKRARF